MKGVILDCNTLGTGDVDLSPVTGIEMDWTIYPTTSAEETAERIAGADVVLTNKVVLSDELIRSASELKYIGVLATGTNIIDLEAASQKGVVVTNSVGYGTASVVQHCFTLMLSLATRLFDYNKGVREGQWGASPIFCLLDHPIQQLSGRTLGIVGYGELGRGVEKIAKAFGMDVKVAQLPGRPNTGQDRTPLDELLPQVDVLSLHCPLTKETEGLIGEVELLKMKSTALLINCARGGIVEEAALANALRNGELGGAGVDVLHREPPEADNPLLAPDIPNLIVTPHNAWGAKESRQRLVDMTGENLKAFLKGQPINKVN